MAAGGEHEEWTEMYPRMAKVAKEEGYRFGTYGDAMLIL